MTRKVGPADSGADAISALGEGGDNVTANEPGPAEYRYQLAISCHCAPHSVPSFTPPRHVPFQAGGVKPRKTAISALRQPYTAERPSTRN
jgi:hypothetical protein